MTDRLRLRLLGLGSFFALALALLLSGPTAAEHHEGPAEDEVMLGEAVTRTGKIISIDAETREVVMEGDQGGLLSIVVPEDAPNFDQIKVGDPVIATYMESVAVAIAPVPGAEPGATKIAAVSSAPPGATPGGVMAEQLELRAVVNAVDAEKRLVTLDVPAGGQRILKVGDDIDLGKVKVGEQVTVTLTRALAISIDKQ